MSTTEIALTKAAVLAQALPWLLKFRDSILVTKFGGNAMTDVRLFKSFAEDITFLKLAGINPVVVHGGGPQISAALKQAGIETKFIKGLRYTEANSMRIIKKVLVEDIQFNIKKAINEIH
ncbi:MAG: acetylglutamate kinase, partial [Candidatus Nanopelagicales bacterium]